MKLLVLFLTICLFAFQNGRAQNVTELQNSARSFMHQGDYANAILVLNNATQLEPRNIQVSKDLAQAFYYQNNSVRALEIIKPLLDRDDADDQCYQIAGNIYRQLDQVRECDKLFRKGIKKFPLSGPLYNELGEYLFSQQDEAGAISQWESGIEINPDYSKNYYNAAKYYNQTEEYTWSILYGEIFVNLEPSSTRTPEIKTIVLENYKNYFIKLPIVKDGKNKFMSAFVEIMSKQSDISKGGINAESLTMLRTRFILDWSAVYANKFPFKLFDHQKQLLQEGMFDAYNQWLFGSVQNLAAYQNYTITHSIENSDFNKFQKSKVFRLAEGQYYRY